MIDGPNADAVHTADDPAATAHAIACDPDVASDLIELAWVLIANAGSGDWTTESTDWQAAAVRWRDGYHAFIGARRIEVPALGASR